jgi:hypothetical protein
VIGKIIGYAILGALFVALQVIAGGAGGAGGWG